MFGHALTRILAGLVRRTWLFVLVTVLACSAFAARAVASLRDVRDVDAWLPPVSPLPGPREATPPRQVRDGSALVTRNMFCSSCAPPVAAIGPGPADGFSPDAVLIATSVGREPVATLRVLSSEVQGSYGVGDRLPGVGTITRIGFVSVDLVDALGRRGTLSLLPAATTTATTTGGRSDAGAATPAPAAAATDPWHGRIEKLDATTFAVERGLVRELVSGSMQTGGARIIPLAKDGKLDGLRLVGVRGGSLASAVGLATGDVLQAINNTRIESANTLLDLYAQLDRLQSVELAGTRAGKPMTLTLRLR